MKNHYSGKNIYGLVVVTVLTVAIVVPAQQKTGKNEISCPIMNEDCLMKKGEPQTLKTSTPKDSNNSEHHEMVMKNGKKEMGFSQIETTHHFLIMKDGGAILVEANDAKDTENRDKIRRHLAEIAQAFKKGIFTTPFAVHGQVPPGVPVMGQLKDKIQYSYEEIEKGARVRILTDNPRALKAIHAFLRFQIEDHQTGDPTRVEN